MSMFAWSTAANMLLISFCKRFNGSSYSNIFCKGQAGLAGLAGGDHKILIPRYKMRLKSIRRALHIFLFKIPRKILFFYPRGKMETTVFEVVLQALYVSIASYVRFFILFALRKNSSMRMAILWCLQPAGVKEDCNYVIY